jgi:hypothetical protein
MKKEAGNKVILLLQLEEGGKVIAFTDEITRKMVERVEDYSG